MAGSITPLRTAATQSTRRASGLETAGWETAQLTPKQALFVQEYLVDCNATQAAIRAGYSAKTAGAQGSRLLRNPRVRELTGSGLRRRGELAAVSRERVILELCRIAFSDLRDVAEWQGGTLEIKSSGNLEAGAAACLAEVSQSASGLKVKLHKKEKALELLMRHLGMLAAEKSTVQPVADFPGVDLCERRALAARERLEELRAARVSQPESR